MKKYIITAIAVCIFLPTSAQQQATEYCTFEAGRSQEYQKGDTNEVPSKD